MGQFYHRQRNIRAVVQPVGGAYHIVPNRGPGSGFDVDIPTEDLAVFWDFTSPRGLVDFQRSLKLNFTRDSKATYWDVNGILQQANIDQPRFDHDPVTREPLGLLIESAKTNFFLNSEAPVTQDITTTAQDYTVSVIGAGTVTLTGTATGVASAGSPLTVTATAGTLTCTVAGGPDFVQVEAGAFRTSMIITAGTALTRATDLCNTSDVSWYSPLTMTVYMALITEDINQVGNNFFWVISSNFTSQLLASGSVRQRYLGTDSYVSSIGGSIANGVLFKTAIAVQENDANVALNGTLGVPGVLVSMDIAAPSMLHIGSTGGSSVITAHIRQWGFYGVRKSDVFIQGITA